jgi:GPH family glycoside/pentoside/hexuronide:cation symporter
MAFFNDWIGFDMDLCMPVSLRLFAALLVLAAGATLGSPAPAAEGSSGMALPRLEGIAFSPYREGQSPDRRSPIGEAQIRERLAAIAPYAAAIRIYGMLDGLERIPRIARMEFGLKVAAGVWLDRRHAAANEAGMSNLIAAARRGDVDIAVIGNETLFFRRLATDRALNAAALLGFIRRFREAAPGVPVTTADNFDALLQHPEVTAACDRIFVHIHPYFMGVAAAEAVGHVAARFDEIRTAVGGKPVVIAETGWPSCGEPRGGALPDPANAARYRRDFIAWAAQAKAPYFYFAAFDEPWKRTEGPEGPCWGLWSPDGRMKP